MSGGRVQTPPKPTVCTIDARGRLFDATELYEEAVIVREIAVRHGPTIYGRTGNVVAWAALAGCALTLGLAFARKGKRRR